MNAAQDTRIARRPFLAGLLAVLGLGAVGGLIYEVPRLFGRRYPSTPYDDLLDQIPDRESAAKLGRAVLAQVDRPNAATAARDLRSGPGKGLIPRAVEADIAKGRIVEVQGWVLPVSLIEVSAIAALVQAAPGAA